MTIDQKRAEKDKWDEVCSYASMCATLAYVASLYWEARVVLSGVLLYVALKDFLARRAYNRAVKEEK